MLLNANFYLYSTAFEQGPLYFYLHHKTMNTPTDTQKQVCHLLLDVYSTEQGTDTNT